MADLSQLSDDELRQMRLQSMSDEELRAEAGTPARKSPLQMASETLGLGPLGETLAGVGSTALGGITGLLAGTAGLVAPGPTGQGADWMQRGAKAVRYDPSDPRAAQATETALWPMQKLSELSTMGGQAVARNTGSAGAGAVTEATLNMLPSLMMAGAKPVARNALQRSKLAAVAEQSRNALVDANLKEVSSAGYVAPASRTNPSWTNKRIESVAGKAALDQEAAMRNQGTTNALARGAAGVADDAPLSPGTLAEARARLARPYDEVASLSPTARSAWNEARALKSRSKDYWNEYNRTGRVIAKDRAKRLDADREFYENMIDGEAAALGRPALLKDLRQARVDLAKNFDVERALNSTTGEVDAKVIGRMYEKDKGKRMTGELATIGKFANMFGKDARRASTVPTPGVSAMEPVGMAHLGMMGHASGLGWLPAGLPLAGGPMRSLSLSRFGKYTPEYRPGMGLRLSELATRQPAAGALVPALGLQFPEEEQQ